MSQSEREANSLAPTLLLSMPQLDDPNFRRSVVLLCDHNQDGAFGLVLNRPTGRRAAEVLELDPPVDQESDLELYVGGPVEQHRGWILVGEEPRDGDFVRVSQGLYLSASPSLLRVMMTEPYAHVRFLVGYAGWGPGQLDQELLQSAWLTSDVEADLVFDTAPDSMWEAAIRRLGVDPSALQMSPGVH